MAVLWVELKAHNKILALIEHFVHFLDTFDGRYFADQVVQLLLDTWLQRNRVFTHLEWNRSALWQFNIAIEFSSQVLEIV